MTKSLNCVKFASVVLAFCVATVIGSSAQTLTTLSSFDGSTTGSEPGPLVQGLDGNFYGATNTGRPNGRGTIFKITPTGSLTTLYNFALKRIARMATFL